MPRPHVVLLVAAVAAVCASACRRSLESQDASTTVVVSDASARDAIFAPDGIAWDAGIDLVLPVGVPKADPDAGTCLPRPGEGTSLVCFGSDPAPYQRFLVPGDGGVVPGQCPSMSDFMPFRGGESCGYVSCGPLLGSAVSELLDAGTVGGDAGTDCCYLVALVCGV